MSSRSAKKTISIPKKLLDKGLARAEQLHFPTFSDYVQDLIRRDAELREPPGEYKTATNQQPQVKVPGTKDQKPDTN